MPRKKSANSNEILTHFVWTRVTEKVYKRLDKIWLYSDCHTVGGVARELLSQEKITLFYKDDHKCCDGGTGIDPKGVKAIGVNINQIIRNFNQDKAETNRAFYALKVADQYKKVDNLLTLISKLAEKWSQK